jgi:hypothetical protein
MLNRNARAWFFVVCALLCPLQAAAIDSASASYRNTRSTVDSTGRRKTSTHYRLDGAVGQISVSTAASALYTKRDGFLGIEYYPERVTGVWGSSGTAAGTVYLQWVAPGDDGVDVSSAGAFIVRYSSIAAQSPAISDAWFNAATNVTPAPPVPAVEGTLTTMTVTGLTPGVTYYFAVKAAERDGLRSVLSAGATVQSNATFSGCAVTERVGAGQEYATIQSAVNAIPNPLTGYSCVVIEDGATYPEQVTVQNFTMAGSSMSIFADPSTHLTPVVGPAQATSTAAFVIANSSVNLFGVNVLISQNIPYGVWSSSAYVQISSVNVSTSGSSGIYTAGVRISSWTTVSYSSVAVTNAHGLWLATGSNDVVSYSTFAANNASFDALYVNGGSASTFTVVLASNPAGTAAYLDASSQYNTISLSTMASHSGPGLQLNGASNNTITQSYIVSASSNAAWLTAYAGGNMISQSTMTSNAANVYAGYINQGTGNTITYSYMSNPSGGASRIDFGSSGNTISWSTMTSASSNNPALSFNNIASPNTITHSYVANTLGTGVEIGLGAGTSNVTISWSTMTSAVAGYYGLQFDGATSNQITNSYIANPSGSALELDTNAGYNTISLSSIASDTASYAALIFVSGSNNTITQSYIANPLGVAANFTANVNTISQSTITSSSSGSSAVFVAGSSNTISGDYIQGNTAVYVAGSTGTVIGGSVLVATNTFGTALQMANGSYNLTLSSSVLVAPSAGNAVYLNAGNGGLIVLSTNTLSGAAYGVFVATPAASAQIWITSNTILPSLSTTQNTYGLYMDGLTGGATVENNGFYYRASGSASGQTAYAMYFQSSVGLYIDHNRINDPGMITAGSFTAADFVGVTNSAFKFNDVNVVGTGLPSASVYLLQLTASTLTVRDDIFFSSISFSVSGSSATLYLSANSGINSDYNDYFSSNAFNTFVWGSTSAQFQAGVGWLGTDPDSISGNPLWYNPAAGAEDFHPLSMAGRCNNYGNNYAVTAACTYTPDGADSPTIDAGDPAEAAGLVALEPTPNGSTANQGSTGETNEASKSPTILSVTLSSSSYDFGTINLAVANSTVSVSSVVVTNSGNVTETYQLSAATVTAGSVWVLGQTAANETPVLQGLFNSVQPAPSAFNTAASSTMTVTGQLSGGSGGRYAGNLNGAVTPVRSAVGLWYMLTAPTSTIYQNVQQKIRVTVTATTP